MIRNNTYLENDLYPGFGQYFSITKVVKDIQSDCQHIQIFDTDSPTHRRALALDGILQVTQGGNLPYHEHIAQLPVILHGDVNKVLVIGAGDGGVIRQLFRNPEITSVTMVEIDALVIDLCVKHLPDVSAGAFDDKRLSLLHMDGRDYVKQAVTDGTLFDLIIVDSTDPIGPGAKLFKEDFYESCAQLLEPDGILITQNGVPRFQGDELRDSISFMGKLFDHATCYLGDMFDYPGGNMALGFASNHDYVAKLADEGIDFWFEKSAFASDLQTLNATTLRAAFALPPYVQQIIT